MTSLTALAALLLAVPAAGLGLVTLALALAAVIVVGLTAFALGATGCLINWILAALALGVSCRLVQRGRRFIERVRQAIAV